MVVTWQSISFFIIKKATAAAKHGYAKCLNEIVVLLHADRMSVNGLLHFIHD